MCKVVSRAVVACTILMTHLVYAVEACAQARFYEVEAQPLEEALFEFAEQARLSINFSGLPLEGVRSDGTNGHTSKAASLRAILSGTGLGFVFSDEATVQIFKIVRRKKTQFVESKADGVVPEKIYIEDLVVTANKRPSANFNLPVSVSVVSALTLEDLSTYDFQSIAPHLAGVLTTNLGPGRNKIFVRGLSDGAFSDRTQSMVGVYIDETPVNYSDTNPDIRLFDVERVELLRGPQGTLYGSGSLAGVYRVITTKPKLDETSFRTRLSGSYTKDGDLNGTIDLAFNIPIVTDKLGFRLTGYTDLRSGYIDDVETNLKDVNSLQIHGLRPALRWKANSVWMVDLVGNFQAIRYDDTQYYQANLGLYKRDNVLREPYSDTFFHGNLTLSGTFGSVAVTSSTAYVNRFIERTTDASDGLPFIDRDGSIDLELLGNIEFARSDIEAFSSSQQFLDLFATNGIGYLAKDHIRIFSHETRIRSKNSSPFTWMAGVYYQGRSQDTDALLAFHREGGPAGLVNIALSENRNESSDEFAVFGEATRRLTGKLSLTGGIRYSRSLLKLSNISQLGSGESVLRQEDRKVKQSFIPKLALRYEWTEDIQSYGLVSLGYRIGGLNINTPVSALVAADPDYVFENAVAREFQSDNLFNAEFGLKSYWFDRQLGLNFSAFMIKWFDIQSDQLGTSGLPLTVNVGEARILGYEIEVSARPFSGFEILGSLFWNNSELRGDNVFLGAKAGDRLPAVPESTFSLSVLYELALERDWTMTLQSDFSYVGKSALNFNETSSARMGGYGILNAKVQFANDVWKFGMYAQNLANSKANTFSYGNGFRLSEANQVTPPRPMTIGLFLETSF